MVTPVSGAAPFVPLKGASVVKVHDGVSRVSSCSRRGIVEGREDRRARHKLCCQSDNERHIDTLERDLRAIRYLALGELQTSIVATAHCWSGRGRAGKVQPAKVVTLPANG